MTFAVSMLRDEMNERWLETEQKCVCGMKRMDDDHMPGNGRGMVPLSLELGVGVGLFVPMSLPPFFVNFHLLSLSHSKECTGRIPRHFAIYQVFESDNALSSLKRLCHFFRVK